MNFTVLRILSAAAILLACGGLVLFLFYSRQPFPLLLGFGVLALLAAVCIFFSYRLLRIHAMLRYLLDTYHTAIQEKSFAGVRCSDLGTRRLLFTVEIPVCELEETLHLRYRDRDDKPLQQASERYFHSFSRQGGCFVLESSET